LKRGKFSEDRNYFVIIEGIEYKNHTNTTMKQNKEKTPFRSHHELLCVGEGYNICVSSICGYLWQ